MIDGLEIATIAPRVIRYLSQNLLQSLPLTPKEIAASIEHLLHRPKPAASLECPQGGDYTSGWPVYDGDAGCCGRSSIFGSQSLVAESGKP
jgi:hypothetical protein